MREIQNMKTPLPIYEEQHLFWPTFPAMSRRRPDKLVCSASKEMGPTNRLCQNKEAVHHRFSIK